MSIVIPHFEEEGHAYTLPGVGEVRSVTQVLSDEGLTPDYSWLDPWYAERGTAIHEAMALHLRGELDWSSLDDEVAPFVGRGVAFVEEMGLDPIAVECRLADTVRGYAGTCDGLFRSSKLGRLLLPDWKATTGEKGHDVQVVAYQGLLEGAAKAGLIEATAEEVRGARLAIVTLGEPKAKARWVAETLAERRRLRSTFYAALTVNGFKSKAGINLNRRRSA